MEHRAAIVRKILNLQFGKPDAFGFIAPIKDGLPPGSVFQIPSDGLGKSGFEGLRRAPTELAFEL